MTSGSSDLRQFQNCADDGKSAVSGELFVRHWDRLRRMIVLRLDRRLHGRIDPSDVLQETFVEVSRCLDDYLRDPKLPFYLWLRLLTARKLQALHRRHLGTQIRDAGREVSLHAGLGPEASSLILADQLIDRHSGPGQAAEREESRLRVQQALDSLGALDREVLALRHYEQLSNAEAAQVLGISEAAASVRFVRALERLKMVLTGRPGLEGP